MRVTWLLAVLCLVACAPPSNPFGRSVVGPSADEASLAAARRMDQIEALLAQGDLVRAQAAIEEALAAGDEHPRLYYLQGKLHVAKGGDADLEQAVALFERSLAGSPRWIEVRIDLADVYLRLDRLASAESVYHDLDRLVPEHPIGPYGRGYVALLPGRDAVARTLLDEALSRDPEHPASLFARARLARQDQDAALERRLLERFQVAAPTAAAGWRAMAELEAREGRRESARRAWERAYRLEPDQAVARRLAELARVAGDSERAHHWSQLAGGGGGEDARPEPGPGGR